MSDESAPDLRQESIKYHPQTTFKMKRAYVSGTVYDKMSKITFSAKVAEAIGKQAKRAFFACQKNNFLHVYLNPF